jgi:hypothetical protein
MRSSSVFAPRQFKEKNMRKTALGIATGMLLSISAPSSHATYNSTVTGIVAYVSQIGPSIGTPTETIAFALTNQPSINCGGYQEFTISPTTVSDAQTRKNMLAILLAAKTSGASVNVGYDNVANGFCEAGRAGVYWLGVQ